MPNRIQDQEENEYHTEVKAVSLNEASTADEVCVLPASVEQHRYWVLSQIDKESTASNMAIALRLEGEVRDDLVELCVRYLTMRHEALRTTFRMVDDELSQVIVDEPLYDFSVSDLRTLPEDSRRQRAEEIILEHGRIPVDIAHGPLFFVRLIHISKQEHFLAYTVHHIACDGWSNGIIVRDFAEIFTALSEHREPELPELPFQFADFSVWQKDWLKSDDAQDALTFWKDQIQLGAEAVDLPTDQPRNAHKDGPGHVASQLFSVELHTALKAYCRRRQATMHQVLLAAFEAHLSRYTRQDHFLLGSSIANRTQPGMDDVVGRFANPQVIIADVTKNPSFYELLQRVIDWTGKAYQYQDLPFSRLMEEFQLDQSGATSQFLQVYFVYQKAFMQPQQAGSLKIVPRPSVSGGVNFDMLVSVVERAEGPRLQVEYNTYLFRNERIQLFIKRFIRLLEAITTNDTLKVSEIPFISKGEEVALKRAGCGVSSASRFRVALENSTLVEVFDRRAVELGDRPAIISEGKQVSWSELAEQSRSIAAALHELGVRHGQNVVLCMEPTAASAAAALAILRLRAVVLPVPAATTATEWNRILAELRPVAAIASSRPSVVDTATISFDKLLNTKSALLPGVVANPSDIAWAGISIDCKNRYETHTSSQRLTVEVLDGAAQLLRIRSSDVALVMPSQTSADAWVDLMLPLISGATILYPNQIVSGRVDDFQSLLNQEQVSCGFATPSQWLSLIANGWKGDRRMQIICRGERIASGVVQRLQCAGPVWSMVSTAQGGCLVGVTQLHSAQTALEWPVAPLPGKHIAILDGWGNVVPGESIGELAIGKPDAMMRTGYLARYSNELGYELVDSLQNEVQLHNFRLQLGDLEQRVLRHPSVAAVKASINCEGSDESKLVAYVVVNANATLTQEDLRAYLRSSAPSHLSSAEFRIVSSIPVRLDGSLDLVSVPHVEIEQSKTAKLSDNYLAPRDEMEARIIRIWEDVLGATGVGVRTNFFSLGGYSLTIVRLFARLNKAFGTSLPITTIYNAPTPEQLADTLRGHRKYSALVPVQKGTNQPPFFLIHSYLLYGGLPPAIGSDYPFFGLTELEIDGDITIEQRTAKYIREMRTVQPKGPYYIGGWCAAGPLAVEAARQLEEAGEKVGLLVLFDSWRPGYMSELSSQESIKEQMTLRARMKRVARFHLKRTATLSTTAKIRYVLAWMAHKFRSTRDQWYLRNWAAMQWVFKRYGLPMPNFMTNISLDTLNSVRLYQAQPIKCRMALLRATDSVVVVGADEACGWSSVANGGVDVLWAPGSHESMFMEPNLTLVGKMVRDHLQAALEAHI